MSFIIEQVNKINLYRSNVLQLRLTLEYNGRKIISSTKHVGLSYVVHLIETYLSNPSQIDYNILEHLKKLLAKLRIYDALFLSKEMRKSLVKALLKLKIVLGLLSSTSPMGR